MKISSLGCNSAHLPLLITYTHTRTYVICVTCNGQPNFKRARSVFLYLFLPVENYFRRYHRFIILCEMFYHCFTSIVEKVKHLGIFRYNSSYFVISHISLKCFKSPLFTGWSPYFGLPARFTIVIRLGLF